MTDFILTMSPSGVPISDPSAFDLTNFVRTNVGISASRGMDQIRQGSPPSAGSFSTTLDNIDRNFSPGNMSSPYYPFAPPMNLRLAATGGAGGSFEFLDGDAFLFLDGTSFDSFALPGRNVWTGVYDDNGQHPDIGEKTVDVTALGPFSRLRGKKILPTALYEGKTIDELIDIVLDLAGWPAADRLLDASSVILPYFALNGDDAFDVIVRLALTDGPNALVYEDGSGNCVFKNNMARLTEVTSLVSQATIKAAVADANMVGFAYSGRYQDFILAAQINQVEREVQPLDVIWSFGNSILTLAANEVRVFNISGQDWFKDALEPTLVGRNEEQLLTASTPLTSGSYIAVINGTQTSSIAYNANLATTLAAFEGAGGTGNFLLGGSLATGLYVQFTGDLAGKANQLIEIISSLNTGTAFTTIDIVDATDGGNQKWKIKPRKPLASGTWKARSINGNTTTAIPYNADAAAIKAKLVAIPLVGPSDVDVTGSNDISTDEHTIEYQGALALQFVPTSIVDANSLMTATAATATINVTRTAAGGGPDAVFSSGDATFSLDRDNGASAKLTVMASPSGAVLSILQVRGKFVSIARQNPVIYPPDFDPSAVSDGRLATLNVFPEIPSPNAELSTQEHFERYNAPRDAVIVSTVKAFSDSAGNEEMLAISMIYRITVIEPQTGISADYYVLQKRIKIDPVFNITTYEFGCEKAA